MPFADTCSGRARKAMRLALNELGRRAVTHIKQTLSTPVQIVGSEVIRSDPGEYPTRDVEGSVRHHEPGLLRKSNHYKVEAQAETLEALTIFNDCEYGPAVNYGHGDVEARPFWEPAQEFIGESISGDFKELFAEKLAEVNEGQDGADMASAADVSDSD